MRTRYNFFLVIFLGFIVSSCSEKTVSTDDGFEAVELPDGSIVLLNHNSEVIFDKGFDPRTIHLEGEAYFKVNAADIPFTVVTDLGEIEVLGTKFNVRTTDDDLEVEVESGKVELKTELEKIKLSKGQQAKINKEINKAEVGIAEFKYKKWLNELTIEFKKLGKTIKRESKKIGKEAGKEAKKLDKRLKN